MLVPYPLNKYLREKNASPFEILLIQDAFFHMYLKIDQEEEERRKRYALTYESQDLFHHYS